MDRALSNCHEASVRVVGANGSASGRLANRIASPEVKGHPGSEARTPRAGTCRLEVLYSMTLLRRRDKMVSIRLSDDEFIRVREACRMKGARSISDLARDAICRRVAGSPVREITGEDGLCARVEDLDHRINHLQEQVSILATLVGDGLRQ